MFALPSFLSQPAGILSFKIFVWIFSGSSTSSAYVIVPWVALLLNV